MDTIHFSPEINRLMLDKMIAGECEMTKDNYVEIIEGVRDFSDRVTNEYMTKYLEADLVLYEE